MKSWVRVQIAPVLLLPLRFFGCDLGRARLLLLWLLLLQTSCPFYSAGHLLSDFCLALHDNTWHPVGTTWNKCQLPTDLSGKPSLPTGHHFPHVGQEEVSVQELDL